MTTAPRPDIQRGRSRAGHTAAAFGRTMSAWLFDHRIAVAEVAAGAALIGLSAWSAVLVKEATHAPTLLSIEDRAIEERADRDANPTSTTILATMSSQAVPVASIAIESERDLDEPIVIERTPVDAAEADASVRWFNGRPIKPAEVVVMRVTAYSPDHRSCGIYADGLTATLHHVTTNGGNLVAADPRVLPMGSLLSIPGYDSGRVVPVLDKGGAIKGQRLDVLYPTHREALQWGVQDLRVTVWEYADGQPAGNPRHER